MALATELHHQLTNGTAQMSGACRAGYTPGFNFWAFICSFLGLQTLFLCRSGDDELNISHSKPKKKAKSDTINKVLFL